MYNFFFLLKIDFKYVLHRSTEEERMRKRSNGSEIKKEQQEQKDLGKKIRRETPAETEGES